MDQIPNQTRNHIQRRMYSLHAIVFIEAFFFLFTISEKSVLSSVTVSFFFFKKKEDYSVVNSFLRLNKYICNR